MTRAVGAGHGQAGPCGTDRAARAGPGRWSASWNDETITRSRPASRVPRSSTTASAARSSRSKPGSRGEFLISTFTSMPAHTSSASASVGISGWPLASVAAAVAGDQLAAGGCRDRGARRARRRRCGGRRAPRRRPPWPRPRGTPRGCSRARPGGHRGGRARAAESIGSRHGRSRPRPRASRLGGQAWGNAGEMLGTTRKTAGQSTCA